ncbi:MAG: hypothetical protein AAFR96_05640 [Planctomycetota bacterium]
MLKFLRKYNKIILVIGGSLLMVAFLAPQAIQQVGQLQNRTVATMDGRKVKERELFDASNELRALNALGGTGGLATALLGLDQASSADADLHWYLLSKEAEEGGFVGSDLDGRSFYPALAEQIAVFAIRSGPQYRQAAAQLGQSMADQFILAQQLPQMRQNFLNNIERTENAAASAGRFTTIEELHRSVAKLRGIQRMRAAYAGVARPSGPRLRAVGSDVFRAIEADLVTISAARFNDAESDPSEAELQAHFASLADVNPIDNEFGLGYLQPQRVKVEMIRLDAEAIRSAIEIPSVDVTRRWLRERETTYPGELDEERDRVVAALEGERVEALITEAQKIIRGEVLRTSGQLPRSGDYLELPETWASERPTLEAIADAVVSRIADRQSFEMPRPTIVRLVDEWQTGQDLVTVEGLAASSVRAGSQNVSPAAAMLQVRELNPNPVMPIQVGVIAADFPVRSSDGSVTFFRVIDSRDVSPPDSIEEVRAEAVADLKTLRSYDRLAGELPGYLEVARAGGLGAMVDALNAGRSEEDESWLSLEASVRIAAAQPASAPPVLADEDVLGEVFAFAETIDPTVEPESIDASRRTLSVLSPRTLSAAVGTINRYVPLTQEDFRQLFGQAQQAIIARELSRLDAVDNPFSLERLRERHGWTATGVATETSVPAGDASSGDADSTTDDSEG